MIAFHLSRALPRFSLNVGVRVSSSAENGSIVKCAFLSFSSPLSCVNHQPHSPYWRPPAP